MRILGIDPGSNITGFGVISITNNRCNYIVCGSINMSKKDTTANKLKNIFLGIKSVVDKYQPQHVAIERVFLSKNPSTALKLGQARGAAIAAVALENINLFEYSAREVKKSVVGYGNADKAQVQAMVTNILKLSAMPSFDAADALAVSLCHYSNKIKYSQAVW